MKINPLNIRAINTYNTQVRQTNEKKNPTSFADKLEISMAAKEMQSTSSYEVSREIKVNQLKSDVQSGKYTIDERKIAESMLKYYKR